MKRGAALIAGAALAGSLLAGCSLLSPLTGGGAVRDEDGVVTEEASTDVFTIQVGDCLNDADAEDYVEEVPTTPCDQPHDSEVYHELDVALDAFDQDAVLDQAEQGCYDAFAGFVGVSYEESIYDFSYYYPTEDSWASGDRVVSCIIYDGSAQLTGSLQGIAR